MPPKSRVWGFTADSATVDGFLEKQIVSHGWPAVGDVSELPEDRAPFDERVALARVVKPASVARHLLRFVHRIRVGDLVVAAKPGAIVIGQVIERYRFVADDPRPHQRLVRWLTPLPAERFSSTTLAALQKRSVQFRIKSQSQANEFRMAFDGLDAGLPVAFESVAYNHPRTLFKKVDYTLDVLLNYIDIGDIGLPDIQRPFVWSATKVRDLFDSMYRGFPVGYLLFWSNAEIQGTRVIGLEAKQHKPPALLIVDGQQRLTSLYAVFHKKPVLDEDFRPITLEIAFRPRDGRFEVCDAAIRRDPEFIPSISDLWASGKSIYALVSGFLRSLEMKKTISDQDREIMSHNLDRLFDLQKYPFTALEITAGVDEEAVADVFVRINSEGVKLNQADFILTLLSVFWEEGRTGLELFARASRIPPAPGNPPSPFNHFIQPGPDQLLRVAVAVGFRRGRLKSVYQVLRGKDVDTGRFSPELRDRQFAKLREAQESVLDLTNWHLFLHSLVGCGFRGREMISSNNALLYAYAFFLLGRTVFRVSAHDLQRLIGRWFFGTALTGRYTTSPETVMDADLNRVREAKDGAEFVGLLDRLLAGTLTRDYWSITLPNELDTSSARSPGLFAFWAAQNRLGAPVLFSDKKVADLLDPSMKGPKAAVERHHLFPRKWLERRGVTDRRHINNIANYAFVEWPDNSSIRDSGPGDYVPRLRKRFSDHEWDRMRRLHALPDGWETMPYHEFLEARRRLIADVIRTGFEKLSAGSNGATEPADGSPEEQEVWREIEATELALRHVLRARLGASPGAVDERVRALLGADAWATLERSRERAARQYALTTGKPTLDALDFCYLGQLVEMMLNNATWSMFKSAFLDKRQLQDLVAAITPVRNDQAHFRPTPVRELRRCHLACGDLRQLIVPLTGEMVAS